MSTILAVDVGTTAVKAAVVADGVVVRALERPLQLHSLQPGWVEQLPMTGGRRRSRLCALDVGDVPVDAVAVTGQMQI